MVCVCNMDVGICCDSTRIVVNIEIRFTIDKKLSFLKALTRIEWVQSYRAKGRVSVPNVRQRAAEKGWMVVSAPGGACAMAVWRRLLPCKVTRDVFWYLIDITEGVEASIWQRYC